MRVEGPQTLPTLIAALSLTRLAVVISGVLCPLIWVISIVTLLMIPFITTHEPPSRV